MVPAACASLQTALSLRSTTIDSLGRGLQMALPGRQRLDQQTELQTRGPPRPHAFSFFQADSSLQADDTTLDG
jgi:hypothetical protein